MTPGCSLGADPKQIAFLGFAEPYPFSSAANRSSEGAEHPPDNAQCSNATSAATSNPFTGVEATKLSCLFI